MSKTTVTVSEGKFTKGEKCIFGHLILTFIIILTLVIIYIIHLYVVKHTHSGIFSTRRSSFDTKRTSGFENLLVGCLYLNITYTKFVCNTLLLNSRWSLCTAHCVTVRTDPDMAHLLFSWRIKYPLITKDAKGKRVAIFDTSIKKSVAHSLFDRETFANNVGLLKHTESYPLEIPKSSNVALALRSPDGKNICIVGWNSKKPTMTDNRNIESISYDVHHVSTENCFEALSPVTVLRNYEFCVILQKRGQVFLDYGAVVFANSKVMGIFSWGGRLQKELPMVIINITLFQDWLKTIAVS